jgi:hypothetical protein
MKEGQPKPHYKKLLAWGLRAPKMSRARHPTRVGIKGAPVCMIAGAFFPYESGNAWSDQAPSS